MAKVIVNNKEYDTENMSDDAKAVVTALKYVQNEIVQSKQHVVVLETAKDAYITALKKCLDEEHDKGIIGVVADTLTSEDGNIKFD